MSIIQRPPTRTFSLTAALTLLLCGLVLAGCASTRIPAHELAIFGVDLISAERELPLRNASVYIDKGRITRVESGLPPRPALQGIDGSGRYLIPGLIDSHVHLYHATGLKRRYSKEFVQLYRDFQVQQPRSYLYFGYTSLIELNADPETNAAFRATTLHPELYSCASGLVLSNDFMATDFDSSADFLAAFPNYLHDRFRTPELPAGQDPALHTPAATVAQIAADGGICVKLYYEQALWWPGDQAPSFKLPSPEIVREVVAEAHCRGMPVLLHGTTPEAYRFAAATGIDALAHGLWEWPDRRYAEDGVPPEVQSAYAEVISAGVGIQPTLQTIRNTPLSMFEPGLLDDPAWSAVVSAEYLNYLRHEAQEQRGDYLARMAPTFARQQVDESALPEVLRHYLARVEKSLGLLVDAHPRWLFGTDTAVGGAGWGNPPGLNGYWEMQGWVRAGIPLRAVFEAATLEGARTFGLDRDLGTIEPGKRANLLILARDPLADVHAYDSIESIILAGQVIDRASLRADAMAE